MSASNIVRVLVADDHRMVRDGLKLFLGQYDDIIVVGECADGAAAVRQCDTLRPDVVLMDMVMPEMDGPAAIEQIRQAHPDIQIIALTSFDERELVQRAIKAGAVGYLFKDVYADRLATAIRDAAQGKVTLAPRAAQALVDATQRGDTLGDDLTRREREVLALLIRGLTNKEIAEKLSISQGTTRLHVSNILAKLGASNRTEAVSLALEHQLLP